MRALIVSLVAVLLSTPGFAQGIDPAEVPPAQPGGSAEPVPEAGAGGPDGSADPAPDPASDVPADPAPAPTSEAPAEPAPAAQEAWGQGTYIMLGGATGIDMRFADALQEAGSPPLDIESTTGLNLRVGARQRHIGAELQVEWMPAFEAKSSGITIFEYSMVSLSGNLHFVFLTGRVQPYLLLGGGYNYAKVDSGIIPLSGTGGGGAIRGGGGLDFFLTRHVAVTTDVAYVLPLGDLEDTNYLAIGWGLKYAF